MIDIKQSYVTIVAELVKLANPQYKKDGSLSLPGIISAGDAGSIITNDKIEQAIADVATWMFQQKRNLKSQHTIKEWQSLVRRSFGPAIATIHLEHEDAAKKLRSLVEKAVESKPATVEQHFTTIGCTLFYRPISNVVSIGPVSFMPKSIWLDRAVDSGHFNEARRKRLAQAFTGKKLRASKIPMHNALEGTIIDVIGNAQLACTIETNGLAPELSQRRSIVAARLAQTAIALLWALPSKTIEGFHLSVEPGYRQIRTIPFRRNMLMIGGSHSVGSPRGPDLSDQELDKLFSEAKEFLELAGQMIACWTSADANDCASHAMKKLAQSIFFFWEGCRDGDYLMSIVKFTASLEALAQSESAGIKALINARLGIAEGALIIGDQTVKQLVDLIYSKARSRTLHGTNEDIFHDWSRVRTSAESLARHCLVQCMEAYLANPSIEDFKIP